MKPWKEFKESIEINPTSIGYLNRETVHTTRKTTPKVKPNLDIEVTPEYLEILDWLNSKAPIVFVTGKAGTGKTTLIQYIKENYQGNTAIVAPTGVSALNVGGSTIHSFFRFPPKVVTVEDLKILNNRKLYKKLNLLIIDEISMVRVEVIDAIDKFLQINRNNSAPFGGVQLLMVGDLFQLPPVVQRREFEALRFMEYASPYFFSAKILNQYSMVFKELTKIFRQSQDEFISVLNRIRMAESIDEVLPVLNRRYNSEHNENKTIITLTCTNRVADMINQRKLNSLMRSLKTFTGEISGKFTLDNEKLPSPFNLALKVGAQVMFTKNDEKKRWVNGTLGKVVKFESETIQVKVGDGQTHDVKQALWESFKYEYDNDLEKIVPVSIGSYQQYPLMLAWAVTIHKSQGKTLEKVRVDLGEGAFDYGQAYVAFSRCRSLEDIDLVRPVQEDDIKCDPVIKRFYSALTGI